MHAGGVFFFIWGRVFFFLGWSCLLEVDDAVLDGLAVRGPRGQLEALVAKDGHVLLLVKPTFQSYPFLSTKIVPRWFSLICGMPLELMLKASSKAFFWTCMRRWVLGVWWVEGV